MKLYTVNKGHVQHMPVAYKNLPKVRHNRRQMEFEWQKYTHRLANIEEQFYEAVFSEETMHYTYEELYAYFLEMYTKEVTYINKVLKPKYVDINEEYFKDMFRSEDDMRKYAISYPIEIAIRKKLLRLC